MARVARPAPRSFTDGWPKQHCVEPTAEVARHFALNLKVFTDRDGTRAVARRCGVSHSAISRIVNGETWADIATLARLEAGLDADLWPGRRTTQRRARTL